MKRELLDQLQAAMMKEVVRRRSLGGYNSEAESILVISEVLLKLIDMIKDDTPTTMMFPVEVAPKKRPRGKS